MSVRSQICKNIFQITKLKYGSEEKGSSLYKCSPPPGFYFVKKPKRFVILPSDKSSERNLSSFFDIKKPRRIEHLQSQEPFSSDPYFSKEEECSNKKKRIWSRQDVPGRPGKVPGLDRTGPRDPEGPMVPWSRDQRSPKVPGLENWKSPGTMETLGSSIPR